VQQTTKISRIPKRASRFMAVLPERLHRSRMACGVSSKVRFWLRNVFTCTGRYSPALIICGCGNHTLSNVFGKRSRNQMLASAPASILITTPLKGESLPIPSTHETL
jgi:hypothetical protein